MRAIPSMPRIDRKTADRIALAVVLALLAGFVSATVWLLFFY